MVTFVSFGKGGKTAALGANALALAFGAGDLFAAGAEV
jgi:hypothetical protein